MRTDINIEEIGELFNMGKTCVDIGKLYNCNAETIRLKLKKAGFDTSKPKCTVKCVYCDGDSTKSGKNIYGNQNYYCKICDKFFVEGIKEKESEMLERHEEIKRMYLIEGLSTTQIGERLGISSTVPQRILKRYGITRDVGYAQEMRNANENDLSHGDYIKTLPAYKKYRRKIAYLSNKMAFILDNVEKRGCSGVKDAYQLDHKYSVFEGFKNGVSPEIISSKFNLQFIPWEENNKKGSTCSITLEELLLNGTN